MYDVIVIGAGPAGCTAARTLVRRGLRVLLAEKEKLPRNKSCSGMLIQKTLKLIERFFDAPIPTEVMCTPWVNRGMIFTNDRGEPFCFEQEGRNVWRSRFDAWLAERACAAGAELCGETMALACREQEGHVQVTLRDARGIRTEEAAYAVDCEGAVGRVSRGLRQGREAYIHTFQAFYEGSVELDPHFFYVYLQPELSGYDAWMNVKDDQLVLGVSGREQERLAMFHERFLSYMQDRHGLRLERRLRAEKWLMPEVRPGCPIDLGTGRNFFAGEAAGFLNPMGEGISCGMESGNALAEAITEHFGQPEAVREAYLLQTESTHAYMKRQWALVGGMTEAFQAMRGTQ